MDIFSRIDGFVNAISGVLYQPFIVPLFLVAAGIIFTIATKGIQIRLFAESIKVITEKPKDGGISSFGALMVSTASRVGTGNIVGVSTALCLGGVGALFWMWITAILGGASAFIESTLAQIYKKRDDSDGTCYGGPSYYIQTALRKRWLGIIFAIIIIGTYAVGYNMLAANNLQLAFASFAFYNANTPKIIGLILAVLFGLVIFGGGKRLTKITGVLVPVMGIVYVAASLVIIIINITAVPAMISNLLSNAFDFQSIAGGFTGSCVMWGIKRGLYSNEAGMGSAPNAAASADVSHPAKQGLVQMLSVFIDTLLICSATAFMCLLSGIAPTEEAAGAVYVSDCFTALFGSAGTIFLAVAMTAFAFTTLIGNWYYCEGCIRFIKGRPAGKAEMTIARLIATILVFAGTLLEFNLAWDTADMFQGLMVIINIPVILILIKPAIACLNDYCEQRKAKKDPHYIAKDCGITQELDYWN